MSTFRWCTRTVLVLLAGLPLAAQVGIEKQSGNQLSVTVDGQPFTVFHYGNDLPKPYFAPVMAASGQVVSRRFPMEKVAGESSDHQHHRGLWTGYGEINGFNFWENEFQYESGKPKNFDPAKNGYIVLNRLEQAEGGKKQGRILADFDWVAGPDKKVILQEKRTVIIHSGDQNLRIMDFDFTLTAKVAADFADTKEGFFAIRLADSMAEKNGGVMTNSEGAQTEKNVWGKPATWVDYDGPVEGKKLGIAMFDHPKNFRHPERWHSRAYGLFAVNPFGLKDFDPASKAKGGYHMKVGESLRFRYRIVIHPGDLTKHDIDKLYAAYIK